MGLSKHEKIEKLEEYRLKNPNYADKTKKAISLIDDNDLKDKEKALLYINNLSKHRKKNQLTYTQIGNRFGVSHTIIERLIPNLDSEDAVSKYLDNFKIIDRVYLEMFSLLFQVSPLYLLGLTDNSGEYELGGYIEPFMELEKSELTRAHAVVMNLFANKTKRKLLFQFIKICDGSDVYLERLKKHFVLAPKFNHWLNDAKPISLSTDWGEFLMMNIEHRASITCAVEILYKLGRIDFELLNLFAQISFASEETIMTVHNWLELSGFFDNLKMFCAKFTIEKVAEEFFQINFARDSQFLCENGNYEFGAMEFI